MRRLMLLRHAKTEIDAPSGRDRDRRLDDRGHKDAAELGGWIGRHPPFPDRVMVFLRRCGRSRPGNWPGRR